MPSRLLVVRDDLFFASRVQAAAARLGLQVEFVNPGDLERRAHDADAVVVLQVTLKPERQLALIGQLKALNPSLIVVAVTGHLETELRRTAKRLGAVLASHSGLDRALGRAGGLSVGSSRRL